MKKLLVILLTLPLIGCLSKVKPNYEKMAERIITEQNRNKCYKIKLLPIQIWSPPNKLGYEIIYAEVCIKWKNENKLLIKKLNYIPYVPHIPKNNYNYRHYENEKLKIINILNILLKEILENV